MASCKPCPTPVDTKPKTSAKSSTPFEDPSLYRSLAGALQYLTFTRPDISYVVQHICLFMHNPMDDHMHALRRILIGICVLGRLPRYQTIHLWLLCISWWQLTLMVFETTSYFISFNCWSKISRSCQCGFWILLVTKLAFGITFPHSQGYFSLLW